MSGSESYPSRSQHYSSYRRPRTINVHVHQHYEPNAFHPTADHTHSGYAHPAHNCHATCSNIERRNDATLSRGYIPQSGHAQAHPSHHSSVPDESFYHQRHASADTHTYTAALSEFNTVLNTLEHTLERSRGYTAEYDSSSMSPSSPGGSSTAPAHHPSCPRSFASLYPHYSHYQPTLVDTSSFDLPCPRPSFAVLPPTPSVRCYGNEHYCTMNCIRINGRLCPDKSLHYTADTSSATRATTPPPPPPLYTSGLEGTTGLPAHTHFQSKLSPLPYRIVRHTGHAVGGAVTNLLDSSTDSAWLTTHGTQHEVVLELLQPSLLGHVQVHNRSSTALEISVAYQTPRELLPLLRSLDAAIEEGGVPVRARTCEGEAWTSICRDSRMPLGKLISYRTGYLPAKFVKVRFHAGKPVSVHYIRLVGVPCDSAAVTLTKEDNKLLVDVPTRTLMDAPQPVLRADTRGRTHPFPVGGACKEDPAGERGRYDPHLDGVACIHQL